MPELPEVETVVRGLRQSITGQKITHVTLRRKDLRAPFPAGFANAVQGGVIEEISRRAKYIIFRLDNGMSILAHLGMSGRFSVLPGLPNRYEKHDHAVFVLGDGRALIFNDARRFGIMTFVKSSELADHPLLAHLGPEPFSKTFSPAYLKAQLLKRKAPIKPVLMDQELVVGVGNIYASEALFLSKIDPRKPASAVASSAASIIKSIRAVLEDAIESGGSSLRDFVHIGGEAGYFQHHFNVYGRKGKPCVRCKTPIGAITQAGRTTFFCPKCQR